MLEGLNVDKWPILRFFPKNNPNRTVNGQMFLDENRHTAAVA